MSEIVYLVLILIGVILLIAIIAITMNRKVIQNLKLPWLQWRVETGNQVLTDHNNASKSDPASADPVGASSKVVIKNNTKFGGKVGDIAGRDIIGDDKHVEGTDPSGDSSVEIGTGVKFEKDVGDIAGRDIHKGSDI